MWFTNHDEQKYINTFALSYYKINIYLVKYQIENAFNFEYKVHSNIVPANSSLISKDKNRLQKFRI